jgi:hypothetical protein
MVHAQGVATRTKEIAVTRTWLIAALVAVGAFASATAMAQGPRIRAGVLTCQAATGWGFAFGSTHDLHCTYSPATGSSERYIGHIDKFGADIGFSPSSVIIWAVFAPGPNGRPGALAGSYAGSQGKAVPGADLGPTALIGEGPNAFSLQPLNVEGRPGLNAALGVGELRLQASG